jgi:hypothetical protein
MRLLSVNEIGALWIFFTRILPPSMHQTSILWRIDNTAALSYIRKEGGLKTRILLEWAEKILLLAHQRHLRILPGGEPSGGCGVEVPVSPRLAPLPGCFSSDRGPQGSSPDRPLRLSPVSTDNLLLLLGRGGLSGSHRHSQPDLELRPGLPLPSDSPPQESRQEVGGQGGPSFSSPFTGMPRRGLRLSRRFMWWTFAAFPSATTSSST